MNKEVKKPRRLYRSILKLSFIIAILIFILGFLLPEDIQMPVQGASKNDYNAKSFWAYPWGKSVTHKGVDIFAKKGTPIKPSTYGIVLYAGTLGIGGSVVCVLSPKWRIHYYAHLQDTKTSTLSFVNQNTIIGTVGDSGNAKGKAPHLHYGIWTAIPYPWLYDSKAIQGWKKMFFLDPIKAIEHRD